MIKPLRDIVFIKSEKGETKTKSGIVLAEGAAEKPAQGEIAFAGPDCKGVKVGDRVLFKKYGPDEVEIEGGTYMVGDEKDIIAIL